ncbi:hypothetical protein LguiA_004598 [Lonicera macranthoides]
MDVCSRHVPKLERIYLPFNRFEGRIPSNLYKCKELQGNSMEIGNLKLLERLIIRNSSLEGSIPNSIFNMSSLEIIDL